MTLLKPTLKVNHLQVFQGGHLAAECRFHAGVNIIRGRNSSGKTTLMDLLAYALGAENIRWKPEALLCTVALVEVELNGTPVCFRREIASDPLMPLSIFWGGLEQAKVASGGGWELYPFRRSANRISFSQAIFSALSMPTAIGDGASNLTMHQLLRVLYADQPSVHSPIFRIDKFDSPLTREMVGNYLCGVFSEELYSSQLRRREVQGLLSEKVSELKSIFGVLGRSGDAWSPQELDSRILQLERERDEALAKLAALRERRIAPDAGKSDSVAIGLRKALGELRASEAKLREEMASLAFEIGDSRLFIAELEARLQNIEESQSARGYVGDMLFRFCPACLSELADEINEDHCHLCTSPLQAGSSDSQILRMRNELAIQARESQSLLTSKENRVKEIKRDLPGLSSEIRRLAREYSSITSTWVSDHEAGIEEAARQIGVLDEEIRQFHHRKKLAEVIGSLQAERDSLSAELSSLEDRIDLFEKMQASRKLEVANDVSSRLAELLKLDLPLQPEFVNPKLVDFDFVDNAVYVNGARHFSESSAVVLRHLFHLALLTVSTQDELMRVPRFMMLDGIDDGGMEKERSHQLQEIIIDQCAHYEVEFQLIFATSEINPKYAESDLVVSKYFRPEDRSLNIKWSAN